MPPASGKAVESSEKQIAINAIMMPPISQLKIAAGPASFAATGELSNHPDPIIALSEAISSPNAVISFLSLDTKKPFK